MITERTILTLLTEKDLPAMMEMAREEDTFKYLKKLRVMTTAEYDRFLLTKLEQIQNKTGYHWAAWLKTDHSFVGALNLNPVAGTDKMQIGCQLKRVYWKQGFASELLKRAFDFAMEELKLPEIYGLFEKENGISRRLLEKLGFTPLEVRLSQGVEVEYYRYIALK